MASKINLSHPVASSAAICSKAVYSLSPWKRELVALLLLCSECHVLLSLTVPCIGSVVCDSGISWSYSYFFLYNMPFDGETKGHESTARIARPKIVLFIALATVLLSRVQLFQQF